MFGRTEILARLDDLERRLEAIESAIESVGREEDLRARLADRSEELDALAKQSLHVVELLDEARQRIRELEARGS